MGGIQFLTDERGRKTAAVIDLKVHKALWEDIQDVLVSRARRSERSVPLGKVKTGMVASSCSDSAPAFGRAVAPAARIST